MGNAKEVAELSLSEILKDQIGKRTPVTQVLSYFVKRLEKRLGHSLIPIYLGQSPSLMNATSSTYPKVILKSPEGELLIAFNTDPSSVIRND